MIYVVAHVNTLYNQLTQLTEVLDASFLVGESLDSLTEFNFKRVPVLGVSLEQVENFGIYSASDLRRNPDKSYEEFISIINQFIVEKQGNTEVNLVSFYPISRVHSIEGVKKVKHLVHEYRQNISKSIRDNFGEKKLPKDATVLVKLILLLYKKLINDPNMHGLGISLTRKFECDSMTLGCKEIINNDINIETASDVNDKTIPTSINTNPYL